MLLSLPICCSLLYGDINWERWCCCLCQDADPYYTETLTGKDCVAAFANMLTLIIRNINWERWCCCLCQYADPYHTETLTGKVGVAVFANMLILIIRRH